MGFRLVQELAADGVPVAVACRFLKVSTSGYYEWASRPLSPRAVADEALTTTIRKVHRDSRGTYGAPRVLAELRLGLGVHVGKKRVARLMRLDGLTGVSHRRKRRGWKPDTATHEDLVKRQFGADAPNRLWFCDITQHRAKDGWVYCAAVIDAYSRRVVGWSISDRITAEIVVDALEMARWRRRPEPGTVVHADRGAQYTSWLFGHRLRQAGLLGSMGRVASSVDNALIESFWSTMQRELLDRSTWASKAELASAMFEWIEAFYNPTRRHTALGNLSPVEFERLHTPAAQAA
ncbi:MAG: IS3 family transposase [Microbacteriaceae bacterium]|nr:IS3 family transposase [Microbacteriaceae bacterium]